MAVSTKALTLHDWAQQSNDAMCKKITNSCLQNVSILDDLPLVTNPNMKVKGGRFTEEDLPNTAWGRINKNPTDIKTTTDQYEEEIALVRERIQIDRRLLKDKQWIDDPIDVQIQGAMAAHMYDMTDAFFNNDPFDVNGNEDAWFGVRARLKNPARAKVAQGLRIDCGGLNFKSTMTAANALDFMEYLAKALAFLGASDGRGCVAYTNWLSKVRMERGIKLQQQGAGFTVTKDQFDREVERWRRMKISDIGFKRGNTATPIIPNTQDASGNDTGAGDRTSIVIVRYGDNYMKGWQTELLKPENLGRSTEYGTYNNILIDWGCGLCHAHNRPFVELYNLEIE